MHLLGAPTIEFCEKAGAGFIKRPFYALSNISYLLVGLIILKRNTKLSLHFGILSILIGLLSFSYDASYTYLSQLLDLGGMLVFVNLLIYLGIRRRSSISPKRLVSLQAAAIALGMFLIMYFKSFSGEFVFGVFVLTAMLLEFLLWRHKKTVKIELWLSGLALFILGFIVWLPDASGLWCDPSNIINGRSLFHILTSISIWKLYKYYEMQTVFTNPWQNEKLIETLKAGGVAVMPTDTIYGIVGSAFNKETVERIYAIRKRAPEKPCIILIADILEVEKFSAIVNDEQKKKLEEYASSGRPTSFILDCADDNFSYLHRGTHALAFRIPTVKGLHELLLQTGPLIAPSANITLMPHSKTMREAMDYFGDLVDLYIDGGSMESQPSRLIRLQKDGSVAILRE